MLSQRNPTLRRNTKEKIYISSVTKIYIKKLDFFLSIPGTDIFLFWSVCLIAFFVCLSVNLFIFLCLCIISLSFIGTGLYTRNVRELAPPITVLRSWVTLNLLQKRSILCQLKRKRRVGFDFGLPYYYFHLM